MNKREARRIALGTASHNLSNLVEGDFWEPLDDEDYSDQERDQITREMISLAQGLMRRFDRMTARRS